MTAVLVALTTGFFTTAGALLTVMLTAAQERWRAGNERRLATERSAQELEDEARTKLGEASEAVLRFGMEVTAVHTLQRPGALRASAEELPTATLKAREAYAAARLAVDRLLPLVPLGHRQQIDELHDVLIDVNLNGLLAQGRNFDPQDAERRLRQCVLPLDQALGPRDKLEPPVVGRRTVALRRPAFRAPSEKG